ncbi:MAG: prolipoprotein diacylglyceryl transferase [Polycyclovorans sp.]|nr:prolipoprotein diacylglyceryl transferase [Polycyclovorans sp.]MEC8849360.1 prolipoprotein diacylglyceryl transferase [Pseudomonadota bacterium]
MLTHPGFDPVAVHLGPISIHWYGLMYLLAFGIGWWLGTQRARQPHIGWTQDQVTDLLFYIVMGVIFGGRIGYTLFYGFDQWMDDPLMLLRIWEGGMSFHGGLLGVIVAYFWFAKVKNLNVFDIADFAAPLIPVGLLTGRIGNFINGELYGAPTTLPWGMVFPGAGPVPRHPSMLYEALLEGLVMLVVLWWFSKNPRPRMAVSGLFLLMYGVFRSLVETVRLPDGHIGYLYGTDWFTMGMQLSAPMVVAGAVILVVAYRRPAAFGTRGA